MANAKTILSVEVHNGTYHVHYSGGLRPDWNNLSETERKKVLRHDGNIMNVLIDCEPLFNRLAELVHCVERYKRREAKKAAKEKKCTGNDHDITT